MKKLTSTLSLLGTLTTLLSLATLYTSLLTPDWLQLQEPYLDNNEFDNGHHTPSGKPHLLQAQLGLFKTCTSIKLERNCVDFDWRGVVERGQLFVGGRGDYGSELVVGCVNRVRLTLPFILLSALFTSLTLLILLFSSFCPHNSKIIEASLLILAGLCQATALLTFVSQIGSEFESNNSYPPTLTLTSSSPSSPPSSSPRSQQHYRYKYGTSFYLFLLSFSLAELAALFDMAAYFKKEKKIHGNDGENNFTAQRSTSELDMNLKFENNKYQPDICLNFEDSYLDTMETTTEVVTVLGGYGTCPGRGGGGGGGVGGGGGRGGRKGVGRLESFATMGRGGNNDNRVVMEMNRL